MSTEQNVAIAHRFAQVWSPGNLHLLDELASPEIVVSYPMPPEPMRGPEAFKAFLTELFVGLPDAVVAVNDTVSEGDKVACRWTMQATHEGPLFGFPATGKRIQIWGFTFYRIADGRIIEETGIGNTLSLLQQLGAVIGPPQQ
jgi:steroid delta-isomerase-like uncharacterized protein